MYSTSMDNFMAAPVQQLGAGEAFGQPGAAAVNAPANSSTGYTVAGHALSGPVGVIFAVFVFFFLMRLIMEKMHPEHESTFGEIKISLWNVAAVTIFAVPGIVLAKGLFLPLLNKNNPVATVIAAA